MSAVAWLPDAQNEVFAEDEVTLSSLAHIFQQGFHKVSRDKDGYLTVHTEGPPVIISLNQDVKMIRFMSGYPVKESAPLELKHLYVNKMNDDLNLVQFAIPESEPNLVVANYYLPYENGAQPFHIVNITRLFSRIVLHAIRKREDDDLLE